MEIFVFSLFGSTVLFYAFLLILLFILFGAELNDSGVAAFLAFTVFVILNYFWGTAPILSLFTFKNVGIYITIGFAFSMLRTYFKGRELGDEQKQYFNLKSAVFRWWFMWPISLLNWIFGKLLSDLFDWIYSKISSVFEYLFDRPKEETAENPLNQP